MSYPVLIPTAGLGSRLAAETKHLNKSLISIGMKTAISRIFDLFPESYTFVVALGYKGFLVQEYLHIAHPERLIYYVNVNPFEGPGSGLGHTLLSCRHYLQEPFIFCPCDTLVKGEIPEPQLNWIGYSDTKINKNYRSVSISQNHVKTISEKGCPEPGAQYPYIGLAGIYDHGVFWSGMEETHVTSIEQGEVYGLKALLRKSIVSAQKFAWYDTGTPEALSETRKVYGCSDDPNILPKENEAIWFTNDQVIKFSSDQLFISNRVKRAELLRGFVPGIRAFSSHMYSYAKVEGNVFSKVLTLERFKQLMDHCIVFWDCKSFMGTNLYDFHQQCYKFYRLKTEKRIWQFFHSSAKSDGIESINGKPMPPIRDILFSLDWHSICRGIPSRFHGDLHFENIILSPNSGNFTFLDWRQDFAGSLEIGDIYYDLAKLLHGIIVSHELVVRGCYCVTWSDNKIEFHIKRTNVSWKCEEYLESWCATNGFDFKRVRIITALIYLNIAALHHHPYSLLLFALGKSMLQEESAYESH